MYPVEQSENFTSMNVKPATLASLPEELIELVADHLQERLWPPVHSVITDWDNFPSAGAQHDLCALSLSCRTLHRIIAPRLSKNIVHDFRGKQSVGTRIAQDRYQWLSPQSFPCQLPLHWIRVLYLHDFFRDLDPAVEAKKMGEMLKQMPGLEVLVARGFSASVLLYTLSTLSLEMDSLKILKLYSYSVTVKGMLGAFRAFPNLVGITLDVVNIQGTGNLSSQALAPKFSCISQLDICARLYTADEYEGLCQILMPLASTLRMVHIHGEYSEELYPVVSIFKLSPIETLLLTFRNKFPERLMSIRLPTLRTLSISTYAYTASRFWESAILETVSKLVVRSSGLPLDIRQLNHSMKVPNLKSLHLQSLCKICEQEDGIKWDSEIQMWCLRRGVSFENRNSDSNILSPQDDYWYI